MEKIIQSKEEMTRSNIMKFVLIIIYIILTLAGLTLMKLGGNPGSMFMKEGLINFNVSVISFVGLICYVASFLLFTRIVIMFDLSYIMPIVTGIVQVLTLVAAYFIFKEKFTLQSVIGASLVIIGIVIMNLKK